jgi:predicted DCC family thiol-disulfide oxidoreductase YuxK
MLPPTDQHPIILFDGVCNLCSGFVQFVIARDKQARFRFAAVQSAVGRAILAELGLPLDDWDSNVLLDNGTAYVKSTAFLRIVRQLSGAWPVLALGRVLPLRLRDWFYDRVARNRYRLFGRRPVCMMPARDVSARFLDSAAEA